MFICVYLFIYFLRQNIVEYAAPSGGLGSCWRVKSRVEMIGCPVCSLPFDWLLQGFRFTQLPDMGLGSPPPLIPSCPGPPLGSALRRYLTHTDTHFHAHVLGYKYTVKFPLLSCCALVHLECTQMLTENT